MDQVRTILNWLKQQHFWVLCGVAALIALGCWWSASGAMSTKYDTNQKTIAGTFTSLESARNLEFHANQTIIDKQDAERKKQLESVTQLWQQLYDRQKSGVLKWPAALGQGFADAIATKKFPEEIESSLRNRYRDYIDRHFPELPKRIGARPIEDTTTTGGTGFGRGPGRFEGEGAGYAPGMLPEEDNYICEWLDQLVVRQELDFPERPSSLKIWVTQENLWVYDTLLDVIAKTNAKANATRMSNAAVKVVVSLEVGQRAAPYSRQPNRLLMPPPAAAAVPAGEMGAEGGPTAGPAPSAFGSSPRMGAEGGFGPGGGGMGSPEMSPAQEQTFLMDGRYLDDKGMPIRVGGGAIAEGGVEAPPPDAAPAAPTNEPAPPLGPEVLGIGYKRLPIRMVLHMDLRWLPQLITNCANEPLRVEVQEVRINPPGVTADAAGGGGGFGGFGGGERGFGGGERGFGGGGGSATNPFPDLSGIQNFPAQPHVGTVVIQGVIYIFNQPDGTLLETASAASEQPAAPLP
jgi:hypothetical protein